MSTAPPDAIFGLNQLFIKDPNPSKVSLIIGAYRDDNGKPYVFNVVRKVEEEMVKAGLNKEYLQMEGDQEFTAGAKKLVFGEDCHILDNVRIHI